MTSTSSPEPLDDGARCAAYLAGDLDDEATSALEARLPDESELRATLERQRALQEALAEAVAPPLPAGAGDRLRQRLAAARGETSAGDLAAPTLGGVDDDRRARAADTEVTADAEAGSPPTRSTTTGSTATGPTTTGPTTTGPTTTGPTTTGPTATPPASLADARARRRGGLRWPAVGSVAAALVAVAVVGTNILAGQGYDDDAGLAEEGTRQLAEAPAAGEAAEDAATEELDTSVMRAPADDADAPVPEEADEVGDAAAETPADDTGPAGTAVPTDELATGDADGPGIAALHGPVVVEEGVVLADVDEAVAHLGGRPETAAVLGTPAREAGDLAGAFAEALRVHPPFGDGTPPSGCLDALTAALPGPLVPVRVEALTFRGAPAVAHVVVRPGAPGAALDTAEVRILDPTTCATSAALPLEAGTE